MQGGRWKVISRFPSYHGSGLGALAITGYGALTDACQPVIACAADLAVLGEIDRLDLMANATAMGAVLMQGLQRLIERYAFIGDVRGKGLL